jgi:sulfur-oxidizing protein SoxY
MRGVLGLVAAGVSMPAWANSFRNRLSLFRQTFPVTPDPAEAERMVRTVLRGRTPVPKLIDLTAPDIAENGNVVPFSLRVNCSMTGKDYPEVVHVFTLHNPFPEVARLHFQPEDGEAAIEMRCRMRQSTQLVAVAEMADGRAGLARRFVDVTLGACR